MTEATPTSIVQRLPELTGEGPIFAEGRFACLLSETAQKYLDDEYVFGADDNYADHELTDFEHQMVSDFLGGIFAWEPFSKILHSLIEKQTVKAEIERLQARVRGLEGALRVAIDAVNGSGGVTVKQIHEAAEFLKTDRSQAPSGG